MKGRIKNWEVKREKMNTKRNKIFSLAVLVTIITVFGLISTVSAEPSLATILNDRYGSGNWIELGMTEITFTQTSSVVLVYVDDHQAGFTDPTGWYETDTQTTHLLFPAPVKGSSTTFNPGEQFGMYIVEGGGTTFYSQNSLNPNGDIHARLFEVTGGTHRGEFVVAFEDRVDNDFNDVVLELENVNPIPEFSTIALPAVSILGLWFFFSYRKRREEN